MTTTTAPVFLFRYLGLTDACTTCDRCGRVELKSTVVLVELDRDGNEIGAPVYYGSTCAARALRAKGVTVKNGRAILDEARAAHSQTLAIAEQAREMIAYYDSQGGRGSDDAARAFHVVHSAAAWGYSYTLADWAVMLEDMYVRRTAQVAAAERLTALTAAAA